MQVQKPSTPPTTGLKRARMQSFPGAFEEQLLRLFSARSAFLRDQLECVGDEATSIGLQLPEGIGSLWLDCVLTPPPELQKVDDETITAYLKASSFFQDCYMVKKLCRMLGRRLLKAQAEGAGASSSDQQAASMQHITQVLEQLSSDLVMEVLRSAPGSLQEQLTHLPPLLASLAALAHIPSLAMVCSPAPGGADQDAYEEHTALTLCVCTSSAQEQPVAVHGSTQEAADSVAGASMWLHMDEDIEGIIGSSLYTPESRPGVVVCRLLARVSSLQGLTVFLPDCSCLLLGHRALKLRGVTFTGGSVVCSGSSSEVTLEETVFDHCSLVVLSAAQATLATVAFKNMDDSQSGLSVFVHGESSRVGVQGGTVVRGTQGVAVQAGGHLEATGLTITEVTGVGVEVQGEGSCLSLTKCNLHKFTVLLIDNSVGVHVHSSAVATLDDCQVSESGFAGVCVVDSTCRLARCTLSDTEFGLAVYRAGGSAHASTCNLLRNEHGARAILGATLTAVSCTSSENTAAAFTAHHVGTVMEITDCVSEEDGEGCYVRESAMLRATRVAVTRSVCEGYLVSDGAHAVLKDCSARACESGALATDAGSRMHAEGCTFQGNGECGVMACGQAEATVKGCHSSQHSSVAGYCAISGGHMRVICSFSEGDWEGCSATRGGQLTMEEVTVDGVLQSGQLP